MATAKKKTAKKTPAKKASVKVKAKVRSKAKSTAKPKSKKTQKAAAPRKKSIKRNLSLADNIPQMLNDATNGLKKSFNDLPYLDETLKDLEKKMLPKDFIDVLDSIERGLKKFNIRLVRKIK